MVIKQYRIYDGELLEDKFGNLVKFDDIEELLSLKEKVKELFDEYLDVIEETSSGAIFRPIHISCCRAAKHHDLAELIHQIKELSHK